MAESYYSTVQYWNNTVTPISLLSIPSTRSCKNEVGCLSTMTIDDHAPVIHRLKKFVIKLMHALSDLGTRSNFWVWKPEREGREKKLPPKYPIVALIVQTNLVLVTHLTTLSDAQTLAKIWRTPASLLRNGGLMRSDMH